MLMNNNYIRGNENSNVSAHLNFGKHMLHFLKQMGDKVALVNAATDEKLTYQNIVQYSVNLGSALIELGIGKGDVVALGSENCIHFIPNLLSIIFTGAACTPYDLTTGEAVLRHKISVGKPTYFICSKLFLERYEEVLKSFDFIKTYLTLDENLKTCIDVKFIKITENVDVEKFEPTKVLGQIDTSLILYSSGTTGLAKGVRYTHLNLIMNTLPENYKDESIQIVYIYADWTQNYEIFMTYTMLSAGMKIVYVNDTKINNILEFIERFITLPKLQNVWQGYGMTEIGKAAADIYAVKGPKWGSVGMAAPGVVIKIVDRKTEKLLGPNETGEIRVSGPMCMKEYIDIDPSTYLDEEGFFKTGDLGYYDNDKYLYITDRIKDIISYMGFKVAPLELESILEMHPAVIEAGVIGTPDSYCGELATAFVVKKPNSEVTEKELMEYVSVQVGTFMQLTGGLKFIESLPRNSRGKLLRRKLRDISLN